MSIEPGGRADKLGNKYEKLWVVKQILRVLLGEAKSVLWEGLGKDKEGIDVYRNGEFMSIVIAIFLRELRLISAYSEQFVNSSTYVFLEVY